MYDYVARELPDLITRAVGVDRFGLTGHSMGGHGALATALKDPQRFQSLSAFAPIVAPTRVPWGQKAFTAYLGDSQSWAAYDSCALMSTHGFPRDILIDQGEADEFLQSQLRPNAFVEACRDRRVSLTLRMQPGYDHSYYFVASFMADHVRWHAERLTAPIP
jgi:S-formylglutathione hydrolase